MAATTTNPVRNPRTLPTWSSPRAAITGGSRPCPASTPGPRAGTPHLRGGALRPAAVTLAGRVEDRARPVLVRLRQRAGEEVCTLSRPAGQAGTRRVEPAGTRDRVPGHPARLANPSRGRPRRALPCRRRLHCCPASCAIVAVGRRHLRRKMRSSPIAEMARPDVQGARTARGRKQ